MSKQVVTQPINVASQQVNPIKLVRQYYHKKFIDLMKLPIDNKAFLYFLKGNPQGENSEIWTGAGIEVINFGLIAPKSFNPSYNQWTAPLTTPDSSIELIDKKSRLVFSTLIDKYTNAEYFSTVADFYKYIDEQAKVVTKSIAVNLKTFIYSFFTEYDDVQILEQSQQNIATEIRKIFEEGEELEDNTDVIAIYKKIKQKVRALRKPSLNNSFSKQYAASADYGDLVLVVPEGFKDLLLEATATKYNTDFYQDLNKFFDVIEVPGLNKFICFDKDALHIYTQLEVYGITERDKYNWTARSFYHFWHVSGFLKNAAGFVLKYKG